MSEIVFTPDEDRALELTAQLAGVLHKIIFENQEPRPLALSSAGPGPTTPEPWWWWPVHNVVAHPLLVLCPPLGERLHDRTAPIQLGPVVTGTGIPPGTHIIAYVLDDGSQISTTGPLPDVRKRGRKK